MKKGGAGSGSPTRSPPNPSTARRGLIRHLPTQPTTIAMTVYLLNTTVVPSGTDGIWETRTLPVEAARLNLENGWVSAVGHDSTAEICSAVLGVDVPVNRVAVKPIPGDRLLCFKLKNRAPEGVVLNREQLEELGYEWVLMTYHSTIGIAVDAAFKDVHNYIMQVRTHPHL